MKMGCPDDQPMRATRCLRIALCVLIGVAVLGLAVMLLWNWLIPVLFVGVPQVGFWQALGILALSKLLFGGFRGGGHEYWRERRQRWAKLSPAERQQLKARWGGRWGRCGATDGDELNGAPEA